MDKLNKTIMEVGLILRFLMAYERMMESGNCNTCINKFCTWKPKEGELVRYNCPHYEGEKK